MGWGCDKYCAAGDLQCGNGFDGPSIRPRCWATTGITWGDWGIAVDTAADPSDTDNKAE